MCNLLDMLTDSSKACTVPYTTLLKCEEVLEKITYSRQLKPVSVLWLVSAIGYHVSWRCF